MNAILFVGHGSKDDEGNEEVRQFVQSLDLSLSDTIIETCFLEFAEPDIGQGIETCVKRGASRVFIIPIILFAAGHAKLHIPAAIDEARKKYPGVEFKYGRPIGVHDQVLKILSSRLMETGIDLETVPSDSAVLVIGRGSSDPDANSDLFKTARLFWERWQVKWVETAFMGVTSPLVEEGIERCLKLGARHVVILPYFLFTGILIKRMGMMIDSYRRLYPDHHFSLAGYFGFHPTLKEIIKERVNEAIQGEVKMNCDTCQYRLKAMDDIDHHHHHHGS